MSALPVRVVGVLAFIAVAAAGCTTEQPAVFTDADSMTTLSIDRRGAHAFLAEYHRDLVIRHGEVEQARLPMTTDTGGYSRANLYRLSSGGLLVADFQDSYVVDLRAKTLRADGAQRREGQFLGSFDEDESERWRFIPSSERAER